MLFTGSLFSIYGLFTGSLFRFPCYLQAPFFDIHVIYRLPFLIFVLFTGSLFRFTCYLQAPFFDFYFIYRLPFPISLFTGSLFPFPCYLQAPFFGVGYRLIQAFKCYGGSLLTPCFRRSTASSGSHSFFCVWGSLWCFCRCLVSSVVHSGYPLRRRMLSKSRSCLLDVIWVEHLCCIRLRSLWVKLVFERFGRADW